MSVKEICPNCGSYDEGVLAASTGELPGCPTCGMTTEALRAILDAAHIEELSVLVSALREWVVRAWHAESELARLRGGTLGG